MAMALLLPAEAWAKNCSINPLDSPSAVVYTRSAALTDKMLQRAATIQPRDAAGNPDTNGRVCVAWAGMSSARVVGQEIRAHLNQTGRWHPRVKFSNVASSGATISDWDEPTDGAWVNYPTLLAGSGCTPQQVQAAVVWLVEVQPVGDPAGGTFPLAQAQAVAQQFFEMNPNLAFLEVSGHPYTRYTMDSSLPTSIQTKVPDPWPRWDAHNLSQWVEALSLWPGPVGFRDNWSQGDIPHPQHGFSAPCTAVENDGHHPSKMGAANDVDAGGDRLWAHSYMDRWDADPVWAFLHTARGAPYGGGGGSWPIVIEFLGTVTLESAGSCVVAGTNPAGEPVSAVVSGVFCAGM
jgi:hypothetical protein